jgi:flagellar motor switch protein FliN/FliY
MSEGFLSQEEIDALLGKGDQKENHPREKPKGQPVSQGETEEETSPNLDLIMGFPLKVSVRLGEVKKTIQEIRRLIPGKVVELDSLIKDPVDILIGEKIIARGEVIIIDENFGIKITHIIDPLERVEKLR